MAGISDIKQAVKLQATWLGLGRTMRGACPVCHRHEMTITRERADRLAYKCHRASCGVQGYVGSKFQDDYVAKAKEAPEVQSTALPKDVFNWLCQRYNIEPETIQEEGLTWWEKHGRVLSPILGVTGTRYGYSARAVRSGFTGPKSLTVVQDTSWSGGLFTRTSSDSSALIVVEDPFSAYAAAEYGYRAVALLGTHMTDALESQLGMFSEVVIALDGDATGKGAALVRRLGYLPVRQIVLERDIKDMSLHERSAVLGSH